MRLLDPHSTVLIIGSGLTMVDAVVSLEQAGHRGPIEVFSRHGLLPHVRRQPPAWMDFLAADHSIRTPRQLLRELRRHCRDAIAQGIDWQAPLDTVRAHIARLWSQATDVQRRQFVRHVRPWWESHHHRSPPLSAELVERLHGEGRLRIQAASFKGLEPTANGGVSIRIRRRGETETCVVQGAALINSSGIEYDWRRVARPLPQQLLARGLVQPGPLALGIAAAIDGAVLDAEGRQAQSSVRHGAAVARDVVGEHGGDGCGVAGQGVGGASGDLSLFAYGPIAGKPAATGAEVGRQFCWHCAICGSLACQRWGPLNR